MPGLLSRHGSGGDVEPNGRTRGVVGVRAVEAGVACGRRPVPPVARAAEEFAATGEMTAGVRR